MLSPVFNVQRCSVHDGPGLRTTVFLRGCPLRCAWCHNPESQRFEIQTGKGGKRYGQVMRADEVMQTVTRDRAYYESSGGGMTISGGEPTAQYAFCRALLVLAKKEAIHACLDTSGHLEPERFAALAPLVDLYLFDFKAADSDGYKCLTGISTKWIQTNLAFLEKTAAPVRLRCPLVPGVNDTPEYFTALRAQAKRLKGLQGIDLLPYHDIGNTKYADVGMPLPDLKTKTPDEEQKEHWLKELDGIGVEATMG